jgi:GNAT superfamily N-acetyltransferase
MSTSPQSDIHIQPLTTLEHFERCVVLQIEVWGYSDGDVIPRRVFVVAQRIGGQVIGAFDGDDLVGFAMSLPGYRDGKPYLHSHMLAVLPHYRNAGIGRRLKLAQRDDAIARGFDLMEWTFDPLEIRNAHLNIARLGVISLISTDPPRPHCREAFRRIGYTRSGGCVPTGWQVCCAVKPRQSKSSNVSPSRTPSTSGSRMPSNEASRERCRAATGRR